jgi:prolyl oligopeptidase
MAQHGARLFSLSLWMAVIGLSSAMAVLAADMPPVAPVRPVTNTYYGHEVIDNYRWLEDQKSPETVAWMKGQADFTRATLDSMPGRAKMSAQMQRFLDAEPYAITDVKQAGDLLFYRKRARGASQEALCVRAASGGPERVLLDLNTLSKPGHHIAMDDYTPSRDGKLVAVSLSAGGAEIGTGRFYDTTTGRQLTDQIDHLQGGVIFSSDSKQFYYIALQTLPPNSSPLEKFKSVRTRVHTLGTDGASDPVVLARGVSKQIDVPDYQWPVAYPAPYAPYALAIVAPGVDPNVTLYIGPKNALSTHVGWRKIVTGANKVTDYGVHGSDLYLVSFADAPNGKLLRLDAAHPDLAHAEVVVPPSDAVLTGGTELGTSVLFPAADALYLRVVKNGYGAAVRVPYGAHPKVSSVALPVGQQVDKISSDESVAGVVLRLDSWVDPGDFYRYDPVSASLAATGLVAKNDVDQTNRVAEEVQVKAKDGTLIPLSIVYLKGTRLDGSAPTLMMGYGAYGDAWTPSFGRQGAVWLARGGIVAFAHVRGGGERGEAWHLAGYKLTKHNTWEDFIACGHYLIDHHYARSANLGIWSQSAGGILIGRTITAEPALVAAAVDGVPVSDTLRTETGANGPGNIPEFGSVKTREGFDGLYAMGAYYHIVPGTQYPAVLVTAGAHDPRVDPWQGAKMAAALQAASGSGKPVLLRVNYDAGHFADTTAQVNSDWTDIYSFLLWNFGDADFRPASAAASSKSATAMRP